MAEFDVESCQKLIATAMSYCKGPPIAAPVGELPPVSPVAPPSGPDFDAIGVSLSALSTAFTYGSIFLALLAIGLALGYGYVLRNMAEREAREEARKCAEETINKWLTEQAPRVIQQHVENLTLKSEAGVTLSGEAADEIGEKAG